MTNEELESRIAELKLNAPRTTAADIDALIKGETFTLLPAGKTYLCEIQLKNTWVEQGTTSVVSLENFDEGIGKDRARDAARQKVWEKAAFLKQEKLYQRAIALQHRGIDGYYDRVDHEAEDAHLPEISRYENLHGKPSVCLDGNFTADDLRFFLAHLEIAEERRPQPIVTQNVLMTTYALHRMSTTGMSLPELFDGAHVRGTDAEPYVGTMTQTSLKGVQWFNGAFEQWTSPVVSADAWGTSTYNSRLVFIFNNESHPESNWVDEDCVMGDAGVFEKDTNQLLLICSGMKHGITHKVGQTVAINVVLQLPNAVFMMNNGEQNVAE